MFQSMYWNICLVCIYCNTLDEDEIEKGVNSVKTILANNYARPDEAEKIKSKLRNNSISMSKI